MNRDRPSFKTLLGVVVVFNDGLVRKVPLHASRTRSLGHEGFGDTAVILHTRPVYIPMAPPGTLSSVLSKALPPRIPYNQNNSLHREALGG